MDADSCLFCGIVGGRIPATTIAELPAAVAFLDIAPATRGHLLVVPRRHSEDLLAADADDLSAVMGLAQDLGQRARERLGASGVGFYSFAGPAAGQTVFHWHVHVVPRYPDDGVDSPWPHDVAAAGDDLLAVAALLRDDA